MRHDGEESALQPSCGRTAGFAPHSLGICGTLGLLPPSLLSELCRINEDQKVALDLDPYVKKLLNARRRVVLVNNILQNAQVSAGTPGGLGTVAFWGIPAPHPDSCCSSM